VPAPPAPHRGPHGLAAVCGCFLAALLPPFFACPPAPLSPPLAPPGFLLFWAPPPPSGPKERKWKELEKSPQEGGGRSRPRVGRGPASGGRALSVPAPTRPRPTGGANTPWGVGGCWVRPPRHPPAAPPRPPATPPHAGSKPGWLKPTPVNRKKGVSQKCERSPGTYFFFKIILI